MKRKPFELFTQVLFDDNIAVDLYNLINISVFITICRQRNKIVGGTYISKTRATIKNAGRFEISNAEIVRNSYITSCNRNRVLFVNVLIKDFSDT